MTSPMATPRRIRWMAILVLVTAAIPMREAGAEDRTLRDASRMISNGDYARAIERLEDLTEREPRNDLAWFELARATHMKGDYVRALELGRKAAEFPRIRANALYNLACTHALLGDEDRAAATLTKALDEGYLDYDGLKSDPDLAGILKKQLVRFPKEQTYTSFSGRNGVKYSYHLILPEGYDPKKSYPALAVFPPGGGGPAAADWLIESVYGNEPSKHGMIVLTMTTPANGWINHPSHHALEDLLRKIRKDHKIDGDEFHVVGFGWGSRPALTYSDMSGDYFQSITTASGQGWSRWDDGDVKSLGRAKLPVHLYVGEKDADRRSHAERVKAVLDGIGAPCSLTVTPSDGYHLESLHGGKLLERIAASVRQGGS